VSFGQDLAEAIQDGCYFMKAGTKDSIRRGKVDGKVGLFEEGRSEVTLKEV
jgi:hypothetical protein